MAQVGESKTSPRRLAAVEKQRQALEFRNAGLTYAEIARALKYKSHTAAMAAIEAALKRTLEPAADEYRALTLERLTSIIRTFWPTMIGKGPLAERLKASGPVLRAIEQMRGLMGLDVLVAATGREEDPLHLELRQVMELDLTKISDKDLDELVSHIEIVEERLALPPSGGGTSEPT